jgi:hypothetical protein
MIKSIWEKIKLAFERKPAGDVQLTRENWPSYGGDTLNKGVYKIDPPIQVFGYTTPSPSEPPKPKRVVKRKPKNESA